MRHDTDPERTGDGGFTLIELLVVIIVLGLLAVIVVFSVQGVHADAHAASCDADRRALVVAQQTHQALTGTYGTEAELVGGGELRAESLLHDVETDGDDFALVPTGFCADPGSQSAAAGDGTGGDGAGGSGPELEPGESVGEWVISQGSESNITFADTSVSMRSGGRVVAREAWATSDISIRVTAQATDVNGYGVLFAGRTSEDRSSLLTGHTFQVDHGMGEEFVIRVWSGDRECSTPVARVEWPAGFDPTDVHDLQVTMVGQQLVALVDGYEVVSVPDLGERVRSRCSTFPVPDGTEFGYRTWGRVDVTLANTRSWTPSALPVAEPWPPAPWLISQGSESNISMEGTMLEIRGEGRVVAPERWDDSAIQVAATVTGSRNNGYGVLFAAETRHLNPQHLISGYTFQVDQGLGDKFAIRAWSDNGECHNPLIESDWPEWFDPTSTYELRVIVEGNGVVATIDGTEVMNEPDLDTLRAAKCSDFPGPSGSEYGFRAWGDAHVTLANIAVSTP